MIAQAADLARRVGVAPDGIARHAGQDADADAGSDDSQGRETAPMCSGVICWNLLYSDRIGRVIAVVGGQAAHGLKLVSAFFGRQMSLDPRIRGPRMAGFRG